MRTIQLKTQTQAYPITIGSGLLNTLALFEPHLASKQLLIVSNETIAKSYLEPIKTTLKEYDCHTCLLPDGEAFKTLGTLTRIYETLLKYNYHRDATLLALGGGVIGDITGFAAATYQRGCHFIQIPTSLLAQTDAAIGGKTAVNFQDKKNMVGSFYQPKAVICDVATLKSLPSREFISGIAEVIKHAAIVDPQFFEWLENHMSKILQKDEATLIDMLSQSIQVKVNIVEQDETERAGVRELLNFGHTFAHAIESATHYERYLHGEAVAIGMCMAAKLSVDQNLLTLTDADRLIAIIQQAGLPTGLQSDIPTAKLEGLMAHDKKNRSGQTRFVLLEAIGKAIVKAGG